MLTALRARRARMLQRYLGARRAAAGDSGFTLVEVIVAMTVFAVMVPATLTVVTRTSEGIVANRARVVAAGLAATEIEKARALSVSQLVDYTYPAQTVAGSNVPFTVTRTVSDASADGSTTTCSSTTLAIGYKAIKVTVTWPDMGSIQPVRADTLVRAVGTGTGALFVSVQGAAGQLLSSIPVTLSNGSTASTTADGCAIFTGVTPGTYTATLNVAGYTGKTNLQSLVSDPVTITASKIEKITMVYDAAMSLRLRYVTANGSSVISSALASQLPPELTTATVNSNTTGVSGRSATVPGDITPLYPASYTIKTGNAAACTVATKDLSSGTPAVTSVDVPVAPMEVSGLTTLAGVGGITAVYQGSSTGSSNFSCPVGTSFGIGSVFSIFGDNKGTLPVGKWQIRVPWNPLAIVLPIPGLSVLCLNLTLTSSSLVSTVVDLLSYISSILLNPFAFLTGGC